MSFWRPITCSLRSLLWNLEANLVYFLWASKQSLACIPKPLYQLSLFVYHFFIKLGFPNNLHQVVSKWRGITDNIKGEMRCIFEAKKGYLEWQTVPKEGNWQRYDKRHQEARWHRATANNQRLTQPDEQRQRKPQRNDKNIQGWCALIRTGGTSY